MATEVEVIAAALADKSVVRNLLELYLHDFSEMTASDVDEHGLYGYGRLDAAHWFSTSRSGLKFIGLSWYGENTRIIVSNIQ